MFIYSQPFLPEAQQFWDKISNQTKQKILANVWCTRCGVGVAMIRITGTIQGESLVLHGHCASCGHLVARVLEGP